jgi:hypothetical protein
MQPNRSGSARQALLWRMRLAFLFDLVNAPAKPKELA